jgi:anti-sigma factor RsiW
VITHPEAWNLLPDAAAGTCEPDELRALEGHLATCPACRAELESLREAVSSLSGAPAPLDPPSSLRARVLAIPHAQPDDERTAPPAPTLLVRHDRRRRFGLGALAATAAVAAAIAALVTGLAFHQTQSNGFSAAQNLSLRPTASAGGASGNFLIGHPNGANVPVELRVQHLAPAHNGYYEVWLGRKGGARMSLGKVVVTPSGTATVQLSMPRNATREYEWVWVTRQRDDGNPAPSHDTVLKQGLA